MCGACPPGQSNHAGVPPSRLEPPLDSNRSRAGLLVGLAAAFGAVGAAAVMSAATAPTARADDFTDIVTYVDSDLGVGQADIATAFSDFSGGDFATGLTSLFQGVDDEVLAAPDNLLIGTVEALEGEGIGGPLLFNLGELNFATGLEDAGDQFSYAVVGDLEDIPTELAAGDYGIATYDVLLGADYASVVPLEDLILGAVASL
jgi:hypothetical protein